MMENEEQDGRLVRRTKNKAGESSSLESKEKIDYESTAPKSVETLENGSIPSLRERKTLWNKLAFSKTGVGVMLLLVLKYLIGRGHILGVCITLECFTLAYELHTCADESVDPCQDFYKYSCGNYNRSANQFVSKKETVARLIGEYLDESKLTESTSEQAMKIFYDKCIESRTLKRQNINTTHEAGNFQSIYQKIKEMGGWPMMGDGQWNANEFNLNKLLVQIYSTEVPGEIDMGMFSFEFPGGKLRITFKGESNSDENYVTMENFKKLCELNGLPFDEQLFKHSLKKLKSVKKSFRALFSVKSLFTDKILIRFPEIQENIKEIDFGYVIENVQSSNKKFFGDILKKTTAMSLHLFLDKFGQLDFLIQQTSKEDIANWLISSYFNSAMLKLAYFEYKSGPCEYALMHFLPYASLRVYVQNYFKKENMKPVSDLVEDTKKSAIEMFESSDWIHEKTKQTAIKKVKNMKKLIGYPEDMEAQGALDKTFHLNINESTVPFELLSQIEQRMIRILMTSAASESNIDTGALTMETNAFYSPSANKMTVLAPIIGEPFFDISYPNYAKIASIGFVLGHEIGHGFDTTGKYFDENTDARPWLAPEDMTPYDERTMCFVDQYESYDDPYFGRNLNGKWTLNENIADDIAMDVTWRTFKNSNSSSELKLPGFERYDINKLFFKIYALNWCSPQPTHSLEEQLKDKHGTPSFRINGVLANFKPFAETFKCPAGSPMNPYQKCDLF
ncbi:hypothetical protein CAEBREN_03985 [Caenorhabditis brenneri]|uniref:Peptidase M13 C-terminal domain-containing protein n=1 Tax=Caenorhabditis brenneri TaxID=135651 RepID=G0NQJ5_CAEBE|nr:hypothetical protein CAEBREN_03985 [Caenorhabditis brenneri]